MGSRPNSRSVARALATTDPNLTKGEDSASVVPERALTAAEGVTRESTLDLSVWVLASR